MPTPKPPAPIQQHKPERIKKQLFHTTEKLHSRELAIFTQELFGIVNYFPSIFVTLFAKREIMPTCHQ